VKARAVIARMTAVCLAVPVCTALLYALVVPAFLGREESAREALLRATALVAALLVVAVGALPLRYVALVRRATRTPAEPLDDASMARLHAAPRVGAWLLAGASGLVLLGALLWLALGYDHARAVAGVVGAAFVVVGSLVFYPAMRRALRPLFEGLPATGEPAQPALGDRLTLRVALAVAIPSGVAALLAALLVAAHVSSTAHDEEALNARIFSLALGVRRLQGEGPEGRDAAARVLAAGGARVRPGVEVSFVEPGPVEVPSPLQSLLGGIVFACVGAALGLRIGRRAAMELTRAKRRVETVGLQHLSTSGRANLDGVTFTLSFDAVSLPEVRAISNLLDRVTETLATVARDQRRAVNARAEAARLRSFVLAGVSHDLRGPLNSVLGFAGLLLSGVDGEVSEGQRESLEALTRGGRDLLRLVDDLLDAARLDAGRMTVTRARVAVGTLLADARKAALERAAGVVPDDVRLPVDGDLDLEAMVDRERLSHHLGAMIAYALLRKGAAALTGPSAAVTLRVRAVDEHAWSLTITGAGSTPTREMLTQLFAPFDLPQSGARAPAGLGLALGVARRVIELHGGSALADAAPEGGVQLQVTLPRARPRTPAPAQRSRAPGSA
jgi:signal transduction histidine kinase